MHALQPKHFKLNKKETEKILEQFNISISQLPKILSTDPALPEEVSVGDVIKIERKKEGKTETYFRVVV